MKFVILVSLIFFASMFTISCRKDLSKKSTMLPPSGIMTKLVGKWSIVSEEWSGTNYADPVVSTQVFDSTYMGQAGDYYEFTADSNLFIRESIYFDTARYYYVSEDSIQTMWGTWQGITIGPPYGYGPLYNIRGLTDDSVVLFSSGLIPEGPRTDIITLKR